MPYTKAEKERLAVLLNLAIQDGEEMSILRYARLMAWLNGDTFASIGQSTGVTAQAVAHSVKRDIEKIEKFAKLNYKNYSKQ